VYIPKDEHSKRPLGLPALEDKIVQKGIAWILEAIYEQDFLDCSYGFRPGRNCHQALDVVDKTIMKRPIHYVIEADIKGFFDNVSHDWMLRCLEVRIQDPSLLLLIRRFLKAGYVEAGQLVSTEQGTPQGGNLSPVIANIFLHYVLDLWFEKKIKPQMHGVCHLVRYADDFLCLVQYQREAQYIEQALRERFVKFDLQLHPEKTRVIDLRRGQMQKVKEDKHKPHTFDFLGFTHYGGKSRKGKWVLGRRTSAKKFRKACKALSAWLRATRNAAKLSQWWPILQAKLAGHYQYYGISGNARMIDRYNPVARRLIFKWLNRRSQKASAVIGIIASASTLAHLHRRLLACGDRDLLRISRGCVGHVANVCLNGRAFPGALVPEGQSCTSSRHGPEDIAEPSSERPRVEVLRCQG
jgi:group II intron reverse transcriptase/maturase